MTSSTTSSATSGALGSGTAPVFGDGVAPPLFAAYTVVNVKQHAPISLSLERPNFSKWGNLLHRTLRQVQTTRSH
jgi:hypothetical protein